MTTPANRLGTETSPYLLQHAGNPVHWWPWGDEAFAEARRRDCPVLISVGYSACHWCHVMAHESFEDEATAAIMNELFVNVKVDREERPDVDAVYMEATQAMTGHGGWPMTVFTTPTGEPFFCGTYFPKERLHGRASFVDVLHAIDEAWRDKRDSVDTQARTVVQALEQAATLQAGEAPTLATCAAAAAALVERHDRDWGGFGAAPKFPASGAIDLLLRHHGRTGDADALHAATHTLDAMAAGGIYDHLGGGFARYSVDERWLVPHFEKMLYDQAQLVRVYTHAWLHTGHERYRQVVAETVEYVARDLRHDDGGFFCAEDADAEGVEGKFAVWTVEEIRAVAGDDADDALAFWGVRPEGNFEGASILHVPDPAAWAAAWPRPPAVERARRALFEARQQRVRPGLDDKVLTEWNGLMVAALCEAAAAELGRVPSRDESGHGSEWSALAVDAGDFLVANLHRGDGRWLRSWKDGRARLPGVAHDHAAMIDALTRLCELTGRRHWLDVAEQTAAALLDDFWDTDHGGVCTTASATHDLVVRPKDLLDGATPSANALAARALARLGALTGRSRWSEACDGVLTFLGRIASQYPAAATTALDATEIRVDGREVVIVGDRPDLVAEVRRHFLPTTVLAWGEPTDSPLWTGRPVGAASVCHRYVCSLPVDSPTALAGQLSA